MEFQMVMMRLQKKCLRVLCLESGMERRKGWPRDALWWVWVRNVDESMQEWPRMILKHMIRSAMSRRCSRLSSLRNVSRSGYERCWQPLIIFVKWRWMFSIWVICEMYEGDHVVEALRMFRGRSLEEFRFWKICPFPNAWQISILNPLNCEDWGLIYWCITKLFEDLSVVNVMTFLIFD